MDETTPCPPVRKDGLQLHEDRAFQRRLWRAQRIAWVCYLLICVAALLGLTGSGGLWQSQRIAFAGAEAQVPRVSRWEGSDRFMLRFDNAADRHSLWLGHEFLDRFALDGIQPEPASSRMASGGLLLDFDTGGPPPHTVVIDVSPMHYGVTRVDLRVGDEQRRVTTVILP